MKKQQANKNKQTRRHAKYMKQKKKNQADDMTEHGSIFVSVLYFCPHRHKFAYLSRSSKRIYRLMYIGPCIIVIVEE